MAATRLQMATEANHMVGNRDDTLAMARTWVDRAYVEAQSMADHRVIKVSTAVTTVPGQRSYALPADFRAVRRVFNETTGQRLRQKTGERFSELYPTSMQRTPLYYAITEGELWFWPTPDDAYTMRLRYRRYLPVLTDNDAHLLPPEWDDVITFGAAHRGCAYFNEGERATEFRRMQRNAFALIEDPEALDLLDQTDTVEVPR